MECGPRLPGNQSSAPSAGLLGLLQQPQEMKETKKGRLKLVEEDERGEERIGGGEVRKAGKLGTERVLH